MSVRKIAAESMRQRALAIIAHRVKICREELARQEAKGNHLGAATERSAMFEAELLAREIGALPCLPGGRL